MDYKKAYEELKEVVINLKPYCNNCATTDCDDCHRKYFKWTMDKSIIENIEKKHLV